MNVLKIILIFFVMLILVSACTTPETETITITEEVEVTRIVEVEVEVEGEPIEVEVEVTRIVEVEVEVEAEPVEVEVEVTRVVEVEVPAEAGEKTVINFWSTDDQAERVDVYEDIAARFMAENPDIDLRILPIQEAEVSQRIATAQGANRLPDIVRMGDYWEQEKQADRHD